VLGWISSPLLDIVRKFLLRGPIIVLICLAIGFAIATVVLGSPGNS